MKTKNNIFQLIIVIIAIIITNSCKQDSDKSKNVFGYEFLNKIPGLWHGAVSSSTSAGNFNVWYVDFRPISSSQISQFSLLDTNTVNNISFFVVKHNDQLKVAMRTEGCFKDTCCVTYEVMDSVVESAGYYRFSDFVRGDKRACTEYRFNNDELVMKVYTNKFNRLDTLQLHTTWTATLGTRNNTTEAITRFNYPQPTMVKDFSNSFNGMTESIFFDFVNDPYPSLTQPYVGSATVNISIANTLTTSNIDEIFLLFTTEPLFEGIVYNEENLKYISKYVFISAQTSTYKIKNIHPGKYYIYSFIDKDHDNKYLSGDYMNSNVTNSFTVLEKEDVIVNTNIDYMIP